MESGAENSNLFSEGQEYEKALDLPIF
jgi:hypothetical protein